MHIVLKAQAGPITARFHASQNWISCARNVHHHTLLHAYSVAITLLPQLASPSCTARTRNVVREAAAALDSGLRELAVEWLEQGRSIVWVRGPYEELSSAHPNHARRLRELSAALEYASTAREKSMSSLHPLTASDLQQEADRHRMLAIERDKLLREIREPPGFKRFLLHKQFAQLRASANAGSVVMLNAADGRCDAFAVLAGVNHAHHVPLPDFTLERSAGFQNMLKSLLGHARAIHSDERAGSVATRDHLSWESLLSTLWNGAIKPVLDALAFSPGDLSRVFWCPTGPFMFLPIHAAGFYGAQCSQPGNKVSDFIVSSYVPTLSILLRPSDPGGAVSDSNLRLFAVRQPLSDGLSQLLGVDTELARIRSTIENYPSARMAILESSDGTVEEVLALIKESD